MMSQFFSRTTFALTIAIFAVEALFIRYYRWLAIENANVIDIPLILSIASHREVVKGVLFSVIVFGLILIKYILNSRSIETFTTYQTAKTNWFLQLLSFTLLLFLLCFTSAPQFVELVKVNDDSLVLIHFLGIAAFTLSWGLLLFTSLLVIAPINFWRRFARSQKNSLMIASGGVVLYVSSQLYLSKFEAFWSGLFLQPTILIAKTFAGFIGLSTVNHENPQHFGTNEFVVDIGPTCLGYQGVSIILIVLTAYFLIQRKYLRFPNVLLLLPISIVILLLLNAMRIAVLVGIGHWWSPEVAVTGFHSTAGWVELILALFGILWVINRSKWFVKRVRRNRRIRLSREEFWLLPQLSLIAASFVTTMFTGNFNWAYPIPIVIAAAVIWKIRKTLPELGIVNLLLPLLAGIAVFVFWIFAIPVDDKASNLFDDQLFSVPVGIMVLWLIMRVAGSSIVVPIVEELAFRGFLWKFLESSMHEKLNPRLIPYFALLTSSIIFGIFHGNWFAAFCAGLIYGLLLCSFYHNSRGDHMNLKKYLVSFVLLLGSFMGTAQAQTSYTFNLALFSGASPGEYWYRGFDSYIGDLVFTATGTPGSGINVNLTNLSAVQFGRVDLTSPWQSATLLEGTTSAVTNLQIRDLYFDSSFSYTDPDYNVTQYGMIVADLSFEAAGNAWDVNFDVSKWLSQIGTDMYEAPVYDLQR